MGVEEVQVATVHGDLHRLADRDGTAWIETAHSCVLAEVVDGVGVPSIDASCVEAEMDDDLRTEGLGEGHLGGDGRPTGEKPQSKLWHADGLWWAIMWNSSSNRYEIYKMSTDGQDFTTTGTAVDTRIGSKSDVLWDGTKLYVHIAGNTIDVYDAETFSLLRTVEFDEDMTLGYRAIIPQNE